jgi:hypothetical protein
VLAVSLAPGVGLLWGATVLILAFPTHPICKYAQRIFEPVIAFLLLLLMLAAGVTLAAIGPRDNRIPRVLLVAGLITLIHVVLWFACAIFLMLLFMGF